MLVARCLAGPNVAAGIGGDDDVAVVVATVVGFRWLGCSCGCCWAVLAADEIVC